MDFGTIAMLAPARVQELVRQIGNTPMVPVSFVVGGHEYVIHLKLEGMNPTGSMKDRTGYALVKDLEERRRLREDSVIIESSSGNLGVALALICKARECRCVVVVDPKTTRENIARLQALGAEIELVDQPDENGGYLLSRLARVQELCQLHPSYVWPNQYMNAANPSIHYTHTAPEIYAQMHENVDAIFVPVSTGGTLAGIGRYFREVSPSTQILGVDAVGSVVFGSSPAPRKLTGIGSSRPSHFISSGLYDDHFLIGDMEAFAFCRALYRFTGICVGGSSGATLAACVRYIQSHSELTHVVAVCADRGENYLSTIYDDHWFQHVCQQSPVPWEVIQELLPACISLVSSETVYPVR